MKRILFVDDEPNVLRGLERMLCDRADVWDMTFAATGEEALRLLAEQPYDVVVSDMRMPGMDGAQLLNEVMQRYPQIVRIVLSGYSERELVLKSVGATHQYLAKPCDPDLLDGVVTRACALRELLADESCRSIASQMTTIPSVPQLYLDVMRELQDPEGSLRRVGEIIAQDVGMTAKILQIVNSAFFGMPRHISDPTQAAGLLGLDTLKALILSAHVFSQLDEARVEGLSLQTIWNHSIAVGALAKKIAASEQVDSQMCDHALMAGLLHDTGKLLLAANAPDEYRQVLQMPRDTAAATLAAEREVFGTTHAEMGAYLFGLWGLPDAIVEAVAYHHGPEACPAMTFTPLTAVHVADVLEHECGGAGSADAPPTLSDEYIDRLGLSARLETWRGLCRAVEVEGAAR